MRYFVLDFVAALIVACVIVWYAFIRPAQLGPLSVQQIVADCSLSSHTSATVTVRGWLGQRSLGLVPDSQLVNWGTLWQDQAAATSAGLPGSSIDLVSNGKRESGLLRARVATSYFGEAEVRGRVLCGVVSPELLAESISSPRGDVRLALTGVTGYPAVVYPTGSTGGQIGVGWLVTPRSRPVERHIPYPYSLDLLCGIGPWVDFDDAFWDVPSKRGYLAWWNDHVDHWGSVAFPRLAHGTMTLVDSNHARFDWNGTSYVFVRHKGEKRWTGSCMDD